MATSSSGVDRDMMAARLAYLTVGLSTAGAVAAIIMAIMTEFRWSDLTVLVIMYTVTGIGVEIGMHRYFTHRSFEAAPALKRFLAISASMAAQGTIVFWVAHHRLHHAFADTDRDPHSPKPIGPGWLGVVRGFWHGHIGWLFRAQRFSWSRHTRDWLADRTVMVTSRYYPLWVFVGLVLPGAIAVGFDLSWRAFLGGTLWGGFLRIFLLDHATWIVNSLGHTLGTREYITRDASRNIAVLAPSTIGGSWHNNHHARPSLATTRHHWWQVDIAGIFIRIFGAVGLASNVKYPSTLDRRKQSHQAPMFSHKSGAEKIA